MSLDFALGEQSYWIDEPVVIEEPISRWAFDRGYVFPVEGDGREVGAVFVAEGTWTVRFERDSDAAIAANRLAVLEKVDPAELRSVIAHRQLVEPIDRGLLLANDAWAELLPSLRVVDKRGVLLIPPGEGAAEEILVVDDRSLASARRIAEELLRERTDWMRRHAFDPGSLLAADALQAPELRSRLAEFRTEQTWDRYAGDSQVGVGQRWLSYVRDPSGAFRREDRAVVLAQGLMDERLVRKPVARERFLADSDGVHRSPHRVDLVTAAATAVWDREGGGSTLMAKIVADLRVTAVGAPARLVWIDVPHMEQQGFGGDPPLVNAWELDGITTTDGQPLEIVHLPLTSDQTQGRGNSRTFAVLLPEPLPVGQTLDLRVAWRDRHRYAHLGGRQVGEARGGTGIYARYSLGTSTMPVLALPRVRTHAGPPGPASIRVGVRPWLAQRDRIAVSGVRTGTFVEGGYRYVESLTTTAIPIMAIGQWDETFETAKMDLPAVRSLMQAQGSDVSRKLPIEVRGLLHGWEPLLPAYPAGEVQLAELCMSPYGVSVWLVGDGLIPIQPLQLLVGGPRAPELRIRRIAPHFERWAVAAALHGHWWTATGLAPGVEDLPRTVSNIYAIKTLGALHGEEVEQDWFTLMRILASAADRRVDGYVGASFALGRTLTREVGDAALFEAVDRTLQGEFPPTVDGLQQALETTSGRDLDDFFDLWLRSGLSPRVTSSWKQKGDTVDIELRSDIPFASFRVPVRIVGRGQEHDVDIEVVDGVGRLTAPFEGEAHSVQVDPDKYLLLVRRGDCLEC